MNKFMCVLMLLAVTCTGCNKITCFSVKEPCGHYYLDPLAQFNTINRVAMLELDNQTNRPELTPLLAQSLSVELGKKHLFSIRHIERDDPDWDNLNLDQVTTYSYEDLERIREQLKVDAIVFGMIKYYESFPRMKMALHLKMVDVRQGRLIWAIEDIWDTTDKEMEQRIRCYYSKELRSGFAPMNWRVLNTSPRAFNKFVAHEVAKTLPKLSSTSAAATASGKWNKYILNPEPVTGFRVVKKD